MGGENDKLESGQVVEGRYRLDRLLGEGGMGVVWAALDETSKEPVALKFLRRERYDDPKNRERFLREANAAMAVDHPNVARVRDVRSRDGIPYLVMDLLDGESLRGVLRRRKVLTVAEAARILVPVIAAVDAAHAKGIVHRDLKPENIFLIGGKDVRVLDFGIAKRLTRGDEPSPDSLTSTGAIIGTPSYMAPEQVFGDEDLDARADVWALGIILYECLAGKRPTEGDGFGQVLRRITTDSLVPLEDAAPGVPRTVTAIVTRMLSRNRNDRPSLPEVRAVLERAITALDEQVTADVAPATRREDAHVEIAPSLPPPEPAPAASPKAETIEAPKPAPPEPLVREKPAPLPVAPVHAPAQDLTTTKGVVSKRSEELIAPPPPRKTWLYIVGGVAAVVAAWIVGARFGSAPSSSAAPVVSTSPSMLPAASAEMPIAAPSTSSTTSPSIAVLSAAPAPAPRPTVSIAPTATTTTTASAPSGDHAAVGAAFAKRDGPACIKAIDALEPTQAAGYGAQRAMCMMLAGDCTGGKAAYRKYLKSNNAAAQSDDMLELSVDNIVGDYCEGNNLAPHDELVRANHRIGYAANGQRKASAAECLAWHASIRKLFPTVTLRPTLDPVREASDNLRLHTPLCLARAGDCANATRIHREEWNRTRPKPAEQDAGLYDGNIKADFDQIAARANACK